MSAIRYTREQGNILGEFLTAVLLSAYNNYVQILVKELGLLLLHCTSCHTDRLARTQMWTAQGLYLRPLHRLWCDPSTSAALTGLKGI